MQKSAYTKYLIIFYIIVNHSICNSNELEFYRFIWTKTYEDPTTLVVKINVNQNNNFILTAYNTDYIHKNYYYQFNYDFDQDIINKYQRTLSYEESKKIIQFIDHCKLWNTKQVKYKSSWFHGSSWIFEAAKGSKRHKVYYRNLRLGCMRSLGLYIASLTKEVSAIDYCNANACY